MNLRATQMLSLIVFLIFACLGCSSDDDGDGGNGTGLDPETPEVLSVEPADGTENVDPDTEIVVRFSIAMDQASVSKGRPRSIISRVNCFRASPPVAEASSSAARSDFPKSTARIRNCSASSPRPSASKTFASRWTETRSVGLRRMDSSNARAEASKRR